MRKVNKEASAGSGGTAKSALAGGGNQSSLTDGIREARGSGHPRHYKLKHTKGREVFQLKKKHSGATPLQFPEGR